MSEVKAIQALWGSGFVNRWHTHDDPRLRNAQDTTAAHQQRVAILYRMLWRTVWHDDIAPMSDQGVWAALVHDAPEVESGDLAHGFKYRNPNVREWLREFDDAWFGHLGLHRPTYDKLLGLCDHLDATLFVKRHAPEVLLRPDWVAMISRDMGTAKELGIYDIVHALICGEEETNDHKTVKS